MRFIFCILLCVALLVRGAPFPRDIDIAGRQIGNLTCNIARLKIVAALAQTTSGTKKLQSLVTGDDATSASNALTGLQSAASGIETIAIALISGQTASADARQQVGDGLDQAKSALGNITSTASDVTTQLTSVQQNLEKAIAAGDSVVANCN